MKRITILLHMFVASLLLLGSCTTFEDLTPSDEFPGTEVPKSTTNFELILNESYNNLATAYIRNFLISSIVVADYTNGNDETLGGQRNLFQFERTGFTDDGLWSSCYRAINNANNVLLFTESLEPVDNQYLAQRARLRGEAFFVRSFAEFLLVRHFAQQYSSSTSDLPGIILMDVPSGGYNSGGRSSIEDSYNHILNGLDSAIVALPRGGETITNGPYIGTNYRAKKHIAVALKAKVLFQMNRMDDAFDEIRTLYGQIPGEMSAGSPNVLPTTGPFAIEPLKGDIEKEIPLRNKAIFGAFGVNTTLRSLVLGYFISDNPSSPFSELKRLTNLNLSVIYFNPEFTRDFVKDTLNPQGDAYINSYPNGFGKVRVDNYMKFVQIEDQDGDSITHARIFSKYTIDPANATIWPYLRHEELLLARAEIWALKGQGSAALKDLNLVRQVKGSSIITSTPTQAELIRLIVLERKFELIGEGDRFFNWKRMGAYNETISNVYGSGGYKTYSRLFATNIAWNSNESVFRIPLNEISQNPALSESDQNP